MLQLSSSIQNSLLRTFKECKWILWIICALISFLCWKREKPFWQLDSFGNLTGNRNPRCPQREERIEGAPQMCHY